MARVDCFHNIAHAILTPLSRKRVHVKLGGDVSGEEELPMKAAALVQWIKRRTSLTCFNFEFGFAELRKEVEEKFPARGVPIRGQVRAMAAQPVLSAEEVASATYMLQFESGREHECQAQARCQYTLGEAVEDRVYVRLGA